MVSITEPAFARPPAAREGTARGVPPATRPARLVSLDAYRGAIMLLMASAGLNLSVLADRSKDAKPPPENASALVKQVWAFDRQIHEAVPQEIWEAVHRQTDHVAWVGCSLWDLIQPSFMWMVGVALPYSLASRQSRGEKYARSFLHAVWRSTLLVFLGVMLSTASDARQTNWIFPNVLCQIGLGYPFLFLLAGSGIRVQLAALAAVLVGWTLLFGLSPLPPEGFNYRAVGVPDNWPEHFTGWFAHWEKNANVAAEFDQRFLNLFPRPNPFEFNEGGYQTLNFVPSLSTMILGLVAGEVLRGPRSRLAKLGILVAAGLVCLAAGYAAGLYVCPIVKRIWTPTWAVYSSGWTFLILAAFFGVVDVAGWKRWTFPLVVVGMNSIAMYLMAQGVMLKGWLIPRLRIHLPDALFAGDLGPVRLQLLVLLVMWLICLWMYRHGVFLRI